MKRLINLKTTCLLLLIVTTACNTEECGYCSPGCNLLTDFESEIIGSGNWQPFQSTVNIETYSGSKRLHLVDGFLASSVFNEVDFPLNLLTAGCELSYDVEFYSGSVANLSTSSNSLNIYQGAFNSFTSRAIFVLNPANEIISLAAPKTIKIPLALATGTSLPSNSFGAWFLAGGSSPSTPADIANFNALIQNIDGISFFIDSGDNISEEWWYDNFCFTQCCPQ